jgi:heme-degrading monooxygenase HmoA
VTSIDLFAVPPGADEEFLTDWAAEARDAVLHRALRDDVDFRFAAVGEGVEYELVRSDGPADAEAGCVLIDPFEVEDDEGFLAAWDAACSALSSRRGYLGSRVYRSPAADFRFIAVVRWSSPLMFFRAREDVAAIPFASHPALYQPV